MLVCSGYDSLLKKKWDSLLVMGCKVGQVRIEAGATSGRSGRSGRGFRYHLGRDDT